MYREIGVIKSGGIELRGMKASLAPRRQQTQAAPKLEKYQFVPFENNQPLTEDGDKAKQQALTVILQTVLENSSGALKLKVAEALADRSVELALGPTIKDILEREPMLSVEYTVVTSGPIDVTQLEANGIKNVQRDVQKNPVDQNAHLVVAADILSNENSVVLQNAVASLKPGGFVLLEEPRSKIDPAALAEADLVVVSTQVTGSKTYALLRRPVPVPEDPIVINITEKNFAWVEPLKEALKKSEADNSVKIYLVTEGEELTGLVGMINCIKQEPGGTSVRAVFIQDSKAEKFSLSSSRYSSQLQRDLVHNVLKGNVWGSYKHILLDQISDSGKLQVEHAYINTLTRGDLASLKWIEGPLTYYK